MTREQWEEFKSHFKPEEFDSPDKPGSGINMEYDFISKLYLARNIARVPFVISSGYRTAERNQLVGGVLGSSHLKGWAADIHVANDSIRYAILIACKSSGIKRIGIGSDFLHLDVDPNKPNELCWVYPKK